MKKIILLILICIVMLPGVLYAAVSAGVMTATTWTNTSARIQVTTAPSTVDSVYVTRFLKGATDSIFTAIDSTTTDKFITSLSPDVDYVFFLTVRDGDGATAVSAKDTIRTYAPEIESGAANGKIEYTEQMIGAASWRPATLLDSFVVNGSSGADSSAHYEIWGSNSILAVPAQAGDSVGVILSLWYGYRDMSTHRTTSTGFALSTDSLNVDSASPHFKSLSGATGLATLYAKLDGYTGNGKNTMLYLYITRKKY